MKWSQLKKRIKSLLADSIHNRFDFGVTYYANSTSTSRAWIRIDKQEILNMSALDFSDEQMKRFCYGHYDFGEIRKELNKINLFSSHHLGESLFDYLNLSVEKILKSENPIIRAFGMLDSRIGKRRLINMDISKEHDLVRRCYFLRCDAENLTSTDASIDLTDKITPKLTTGISKQKIKPKEITAAKLSKDNRLRNTKRLINLIYNNKIQKEALETEVSKAFFEAFENTANRDLLYQTFLLWESETELLDNTSYIKACAAMVQDCGDWQRPLGQWKPKSHNQHKQFSSLTRHLWVKYKMPAFMDKAWLTGNTDHQQWYKDIGSGKNIRNSSHLPVPLTKIMARHFLLAPDYYSIEGAFRWAQIHALGGDKRLADAILETRLSREFIDHDFWLSVIRFFARNPLLDTTHINPIVDYIWNQKYENRVIFTERGVAREVGPAQPNISMKGRTAESLLKAVNAWHRQLGKETKDGDLQWKVSDIREFVFVEGSEKSKNMKIWRIKELLNSRELILEGRQMHHCVATYARSCSSGKCSIWSMEVQTDENREKLLTIEVNNADMEIRQIRGKFNRLPAEKEKEIIKRWAGREELKMAAYLQ